MSRRRRSPSPEPVAHDHPRHRNLLRRDGGRAGRGDRRRRTAVAPALERRRVAGRRSTASGAASCRSCRPGSTSATSAAWSSARCSTAGRARYDAIAVTQGPGLVGSLLVGLAFAKSLAWARGVPLIPVHHLAGHIESLVLEDGEMPLPAVVLVVSGGHTSLYLVRPRRRARAARPHARRCGGRGLRQGGQAARPRVSGRAGHRSAGRRGQRPRRAVSEDAADARRPQRAAPPGRRDFSFSGLKTAVLRHVTAGVERSGLARPSPLPDRRDSRHLRQLSARGRRSPARPVCSRPRDGTARAASGIAGGVSANSRLRADARARGEARGLPVFIPSLALSTDNAAMIAAAGLRAFRAGTTAGVGPQRRCGAQAGEFGGSGTG